jgi:nucleoid-associated protein YgaU
MDDIIKINDLDNPDLIMPGMKLLIPKKGFMK